MNNRHEGIQHVKLSNGNGEQEQMITATIKPVTLWKWVALLFPIVIGILWATTKFGAFAAVDSRIDKHCKPPNGVIYRTMESFAHERAREVTEDMEEKLGPLAEEIQSNGKAISELKGSTDQLIRQQEQLIREIRTDRDGG
jgi:hypothetical protein